MARAERVYACCNPVLVTCGQQQGASAGGETRVHDGGKPARCQTQAARPTGNQESATNQRQEAVVVVEKESAALYTGVGCLELAGAWQSTGAHTSLQRVAAHRRTLGSCVCAVRDTRARLFICTKSELEERTDLRNSPARKEPRYCAIWSAHWGMIVQFSASMQASARASAARCRAAAAVAPLHCRSPRAAHRAKRVLCRVTSRRDVESECFAGVVSMDNESDPRHTLLRGERCMGRATRRSAGVLRPPCCSRPVAMRRGS